MKAKAHIARRDQLDPATECQPVDRSYDGYGRVVQSIDDLVQSTHVTPSASCIEGPALLQVGASAERPSCARQDQAAKLEILLDLSEQFVESLIDGRRDGIQSLRRVDRGDYEAGMALYDQTLSVLLPTGPLSDGIKDHEHHDRQHNNKCRDGRKDRTDFKEDRIPQFHRKRFGPYAREKQSEDDLVKRDVKRQKRCSGYGDQDLRRDNQKKGFDRASS